MMLDFSQKNTRKNFVWTLSHHRYLNKQKLNRLLRQKELDSLHVQEHASGHALLDELPILGPATASEILTQNSPGYRGTDQNMFFFMFVNFPFADHLGSS